MRTINYSSSPNLLHFGKHFTRETRPFFANTHLVPQMSLKTWIFKKVVNWADWGITILFATLGKISKVRWLILQESCRWHSSMRCSTSSQQTFFVILFAEELLIAKERKSNYHLVQVAIFMSSYYSKVSNSRAST